VSKAGRHPTKAKELVEARAEQLFSVAILLSAYLSPAARSCAVVADNQALRDLHAANVPPIEANLYRAEVEGRGAIEDLDDLDGITPDDIHEWYGARAAQWSATGKLIQVLLDIAPTEADCERAFSRLKNAVTANRSHATPQTSTAHLLYASGRAYIRQIGSLKLQREETLPAELFIWICAVAARTFRAAAPAPPAARAALVAPQAGTRHGRDEVAQAAAVRPARGEEPARPVPENRPCCICKVPHDKRSSRKDYSVGYDCTKCGAWVGKSCLAPLGNRAEIAEIEASGFCPTDFRRR
jgi:hypothetical protein